jgi:hypothetical protein
MLTALDLRRPEAAASSGAMSASARACFSSWVTWASPVELTSLTMVMMRLGSGKSYLYCRSVPGRVWPAEEEGDTRQNK